MNAHSCHCMEKSASCDVDWADNMDHIHSQNEAFHHHSGCSECHSKQVPHHPYLSQNQLQDDNTNINAYDRRPSNKTGDSKADNHEVAKVIPRDRTMISTPTTPACYSEKESDSIHQAYAQKFAHNNHRSEASDHSKIVGPTSITSNTGKCFKPDSQFCLHQNSPPPTSSATNCNCGSTSDKGHSSTYGCQKAGGILAAKPLPPPPMVAAVNVVRPPCPYCGSRIAKCLGCGYNTYGQAYPPPTFSSTIDPALQFNCCSSVNQSTTPLPQTQVIDEACEKRLNACIKDVSKNLTWVLNSLQRFKYCPVCGNPNCSP